MTPGELTGQTRSHVVEMPTLPCVVHAGVVTPLSGLRRAAAAAGFDLKPVSAFRDFDRQMSIWNGKFEGSKPVLDGSGTPLDVLQLDPPQRVAAILLWSALPGASRHHWGTDVDFIDAAALPPGYRVQLTPEEFAAGGLFAPVCEWLEANAARFGFFRPFRGIRSGVRAEPWHFSFAPLAEPARRALSPGVLAATLAGSALRGRDEVLARIDELHERYVAAIDWP